MADHQHLTESAQMYIRLTEDTLGDLSFLLDNIGESIDLDLSIESVDALETLLASIHGLAAPDDLFPDLVETYAQLLARYVALVHLEHCNGQWDVDQARSSAFCGQPFVEVAPGQPERRYYPIHWQAAFRDPEVVFSRHRLSLARMASGSIRARRSFENLVRSVADTLRASPDGALGEQELVAELTRQGLGPSQGAHSMFDKALAKRVGAVLRKSSRFSKRRTDGRWRETTAEAHTP